MTTLTLWNTSKFPLRADTPLESVRLESGERKTVQFPVGKNARCRIAPIKAWKFHLLRHGFLSFWDDIGADSILGFLSVWLNKPPVELILTATSDLYLTESAIYQITVDTEYYEEKDAEILVPRLLSVTANEVSLPEWQKIRGMLKRRLIGQETVRMLLLAAILVFAWTKLIAISMGAAITVTALLSLVIVLPVAFFSIRFALRLYRTLTARFGA